MNQQAKPEPEASELPIKRLSRRLRKKYGARITGEIVQPASEGCFQDLPVELHPKLTQVLTKEGKTRLYSHQAEAWDYIRSGRHTVIVTPTASGKSLCFNLPVVQAALTEKAKALYLFPTKALAQDQVAALNEWNQDGELGVRAFTFDGDTPSDARKAVRTKGDIVVSNPDMMHRAILPHHTKWAQFFESLKFVVVDEMHTYRGVFGSHVANLFRRFWRICEFYGASPTFVFCSATLANPQQLAEQLLGKPAALITRSGAPSGEKTLLLWNPPVVNPDLGIRASARSQATRIAKESVAGGLKSIVFAQTRLMVEVITKYLKDTFDNDPRKPARVRAYRGGYLPTQRRAAERDLRAGQVDCVVSTSALELGVDIGSLDVCILNGYPGTIAATWQRLGRAGRRNRPSLGVLVANSQALDQYVIRNPNFFADATPEHARISPDQLLILLEHVRCAAFELPFRNPVEFGEQNITELLQYLESEGVLHHDGVTWHWMEDSYPAGQVNLRSIANGNFVVVDRTDGAQKIIAEVDFSSAPLTLYEGAIYMIESAPWQVEKLDWVGRKAYVKKTTVDYYTDAIDYTKLKILERFDSAGQGPTVCDSGEVHVVRRITGYKKIRYYTHENIGYGPIDLPDQEIHTTAVWWHVAANALESVFESREQALDGFLGAAYAMHAVACLRMMCEPRDLGKAVGNADGQWFATVDERGRGSIKGKADNTVDPTATAVFTPTVFLYDNYPGGVGISDPLFEHHRAITHGAATLISHCECELGCPACIGPVLASDETRTFSGKQAALKLLAMFADQEHGHAVVA